MAGRAYTIASRPRVCREQGAALIVTLILLLVLTITGVAGMAGSVLQERMAGNLQHRQQLFQATEAALRLCAARVVTGATSASGPASALERTAFANGATAAPDEAERFAVSQTFSAQGNTAYQLACLIEHSGPVDTARIGGSLSRPTARANLVAYTVTASGARVAGAGAAAQRPSVLLQAKVVVRR